MREKIMANYPDRPVIIGRCAHLTKPNPIHIQQGRGQCQARDMCERGCPFGGYFNSNSTTIPWAQRTGKLTLQPFSVVHSIIYDEKKGKATGVRVIDAKHKNRNRILRPDHFCKRGLHQYEPDPAKLSTSNRFPNGLGNDNGILGHYIIFHNYRGGVGGTFEGFPDKYYYGRRPTELFIPNYRNLRRDEGLPFKRGYMSTLSAGRANWGRGEDTPGLGADYKTAITEPGIWEVGMGMQGETIPKFTNHVRLSPDLKDQWGIPQLITSVAYDDNDDKMVDDFVARCSEMLDTAGCKNISGGNNHQNPGLDIHEMGGARMGKDPKTSMLNEWNQLHHCKNVFVTDGACMVSTGNQNPSITFMALTARAANHAVEELKRQNL